MQFLVEEIFAVASRSFNQDEKDLIILAFNKAYAAHDGQKRKSGEPYFSHVYEAGIITSSWGLDAITVAATLLHDTLEDTDYSQEELQKDFGPEVLHLVQGATKIGHIKYRGNVNQAETLRKMILALSEDVRVVFVKLADRMHNMRTLKYLPEEKRRRIALETNDIYAPLAYRMGLGSVSGDLEDLAFPVLYPKEYRELSKKIADHLKWGEEYMVSMRKNLEKALSEHPYIKVLQIDSRAKRISSLYKKLQKVGTLDNIYDLLALRIIVENVEHCYATLGIIHNLWPPLPGKIKDYIALPKPNGYRSLHTTVIALENKPTEIQIRTEEMHRENEFGIAAYWAYAESKSSKEYVRGSSPFASARQLAWINQLKVWQDKMDDPDEFIASLKIDFFKDRIFCITPKGEAVDLPSGSCPIDFAYQIHSEIGDHCFGAKVNDRIVPLNYELQSGDVVEILTQKNKKPNAQWLRFVKTRHARNRINSMLHGSASKRWLPFSRKKKEREF